MPLIPAKLLGFLKEWSLREAPFLRFDNWAVYGGETSLNAWNFHNSLPFLFPVKSRFYKFGDRISWQTFACIKWSLFFWILDKSLFGLWFLALDHQTRRHGCLLFSLQVWYRIWRVSHSPTHHSLIVRTCYCLRIHGAAKLAAKLAAKNSKSGQRGVFWIWIAFLEGAWVARRNDGLKFSARHKVAICYQRWFKNVDFLLLLLQIFIQAIFELVCCNDAIKTGEVWILDISCCKAATPCRDDLCGFSNPTRRPQVIVCNDGHTFAAFN